MNLATQFGRGHIDDPEGIKVTPITLHPAMRGWVGESSPKFEAETPDVMQQGGTGTCTMHGVAVAMYPVLRFVASQSDGYKLALGVRRADLGLPKDTPFEDKGAEPNELVRALQTFGVRPRGTSPDYDARNSDADPATITDEIAEDEFAADAQNIYLGQYLVSTPDEMQATMAATKRALTGSFFVDTIGPRSVQGWDPSTGPLGRPVTPKDPRGGLHQVAIIGYERTPSGRVWTVRNSWGKNWGLAGNFLATDEWVMGFTSCYSWDVRKAA